MKLEEIRVKIREGWKRIIGNIDRVISVGILGKELKYPRREEIFLTACVISGIIIHNALPKTVGGEGGISIIILTFILIYGIIVYSCKNLLSSIKGIKVWEISIGILFIIIGLLLLGRIKETVGIQSTFGVSNTVVLLVGLTVLFYGIRDLDITWGFFAMLFAIALANIVFIGDSPIEKFAGETLAPLEANWLSSLLNFLGYKTYVVYGKEVSTVVFEDNFTRVPIGGACTGIQGMTLYTTLTAGILIGTHINYKRRVIYLALGASILFFLNFLRLLILSLVGYHYGMNKMYEVHEWLGGVIFMIFVVIFWIIIIGRDLRRREKNVRT